jgi:truncated hemoglobin YjbI
VTLEHRRFLPFADFRGTELFRRVDVDRLVDTLYDGLGADPALRAFFAGDRSAERARQKLFFAEWLGGPSRYSERAWGGLAQRHAELVLTPALAEHWLGHFRRALEVAAPESDGPALFAAARALALALVEGAPPPWGTTRVHCLASDHPFTVARELARQGQAAALAELQRRHPGFLERPVHAAALLHAAALAGRLEVVTWLLEGGVSPDLPTCLPVGDVGVAFERIILITPLGAARWRKRAGVVAALQARGARDDVFTASFLGDDASLRRMLEADAALAQAADPALDVVEITAIHHAVAGRRESALAMLLDHAPSVRGADRALRGAAAAGSLPMVSRLLAAGADARRVGTGRWVLDPALAPVLAAAGATVDGGWIGASCTGNQGRRDDPEYVRALLDHGARVDDRREGTGATALHHAARAGFLGTIAVLLGRGADPAARDAEGQTPLEWLERAAKSVDRQAVRRLLTASPGTRP